MLASNRGSAWRDRAKAVASKPGPTSGNTSAKVWGSFAKRRSAREDESNVEIAHPETLTDYEIRQRRERTKYLLG